MLSSKQLTVNNYHISNVATSLHQKKIINISKPVEAHALGKLHLVQIISICAPR